MKPVHLSIVVPAFNEEKRLPPTLEAIDAYRRARPFETEVLVINDCSTDGTATVAARFAETHPGFRLISHERNLGKGAAVRTGMLAASGAFRLFTDADNSTPIEEADGFLRLMTGSSPCDVVIASRRVAGARLEVRQPFHREASGRLYSLLVRALVLRGFLDTQCGFKMFTARAAQDIFSRQTILGFGFDIEILSIAVKTLGLRVKEAPIHWRDSPVSRVRLLQDSLGMFVELFRLRRRVRG